MTRALSILVPCDSLSVDDMRWQGVANMYLEALAHFPQVMPVIVPAVLPLLTLARYLEQTDGVLLTGAESNVHPMHYGGRAGPSTEPYDSARDRVTLELAAQALKRDMPVVGLRPRSLDLRGVSPVRAGRCDRRRLVRGIASVGAHLA